MVLADGVKAVGAAAGIAAGLGNEERIARHRELAGVAGKVVGVEIGRDHVELRLSGPPNVQHAGHGAAAGETPCRGPAVVEPGVGVHGDGILGFARRRHRVDEPRVVPGLEDAVRPAVFSEDLGPRAGRAEARRLPDLCQGGVERRAVLLQIGHQFLRDRLGERRVGGRGAIARVGHRADLILDLHHHHGMLPAVDLAEMAHQGGEGPRVGLAIGLAQAREHLDVAAILVLHAGEPGGIFLHP